MIMQILAIIIINPITNKEKRSPKTLTKIKQAKILKQIIMTPHPYPPTVLPCFPILNPPKKQLQKYERHSKTLDIEIEKSKKCG